MFIMMFHERFQGRPFPFFHGSPASLIRKMIFTSSGQILPADRETGKELYFSFDRHISEGSYLAGSGLVLEFDAADLVRRGIVFTIGPETSSNEFITAQAVPLEALTIQSKQLLVTHFWAKGNTVQNLKLAKALGYLSIELMEKDVGRASDLIEKRQKDLTERISAAKLPVSQAYLYRMLL